MHAEPLHDTTADEAYATCRVPRAAVTPELFRCRRRACHFHAIISMSAMDTYASSLVFSAMAGPSASRTYKELEGLPHKCAQPRLARAYARDKERYAAVSSRALAIERCILRGGGPAPPPVSGHFLSAPVPLATFCLDMLAPPRSDDAAMGFAAMPLFALGPTRWRACRRRMLIILPSTVPPKIHDIGFAPDKYTVELAVVYVH